MREIKYRAWDNVANEMYYTGEEELIVFIFGSNGIVADEIILDDSEQGYHVEKLEHLQYMQYTGLKDTNSKEIYEGDILKTASGRDKGDIITVVEWTEFSWKEKLISSPVHQFYEYFDFSDETGNDCEVIGNIYENPELLEGIA